MIRIENAPDYLTQFTNVSKPAKVPIFNGSVVVLTDALTAKTAEVFALYAKQMERFTVIGERTAGMPSKTAVFPLPEGGTFYISTMAIKTQEGEYVNNNGIEPNIYHKSTDSNPDKLVEKAIQYLNVQ